LWQGRWEDAKYSKDETAAPSINRFEDALAEIRALGDRYRDERMTEFIGTGSFFRIRGVKRFHHQNVQMQILVSL
jgi:hypothetical protein